MTIFGNNDIRKRKKSIVLHSKYIAMLFQVQLAAILQAL